MSEPCVCSGWERVVGRSLRMWEGDGGGIVGLGKWSGDVGMSAVDLNLPKLWVVRLRSYLELYPSSCTKERKNSISSIFFKSTARERKKRKKGISTHVTRGLFDSNTGNKCKRITVRGGDIGSDRHIRWRGSARHMVARSITEVAR